MAAVSPSTCSTYRTPVSSSWLATRMSLAGMTESVVSSQDCVLPVLEYFLLEVSHVEQGTDDSYQETLSHDRDASSTDQLELSQGVT